MKEIISGLKEIEFTCPLFLGSPKVGVQGLRCDSGYQEPSPFLFLASAQKHFMIHNSWLFEL